MTIPIGLSDWSGVSINATASIVETKLTVVHLTENIEWSNNVDDSLCDYKEELPSTSYSFYCSSCKWGIEPTKQHIGTTEAESPLEFLKFGIHGQDKFDSAPRETFAIIENRGWGSLGLYVEEVNCKPQERQYKKILKKTPRNRRKRQNPWQHHTSNAVRKQVILDHQPPVDLF